MFNPNPQEEKWSLVEMELKFVIEPQISPYRGPLYFGRSLETAMGDSVIANGGFGLVDTGKKKLLVTCHHVWEGFQEERRKDSSARMFVGLDRQPPVVFDQSEPIDHDKSLDIVTFDMTPMLAFCDGRKFYPLNRNPAPLPAKGSQLVVVGNQGIFRSGTKNGLCFGATTYSLQVADFSGFRVVADLSKAETKYAMQPMRASQPETSPHGGISGSPCFLVRQDSQAHLVGFVTANCLGTLLVTHVRCLNPDGTINRMAS